MSKIITADAARDATAKSQNAHRDTHGMAQARAVFCEMQEEAIRQGRSIVWMQFNVPLTAFTFQQELFSMGYDVECTDHGSNPEIKVSW